MSITDAYERSSSIRSPARATGGASLDVAQDWAARDAERSVLSHALAGGRS